MGKQKIINNFLPFLYRDISYIACFFAVNVAASLTGSQYIEIATHSCGTSTLHKYKEMVQRKNGDPMQVVSSRMFPLPQQYKYLLSSCKLPHFLNGFFFDPEIYSWYFK